MSNTRLVNNIEWVGYIDWDVRDFHGYTTDSGSTYNAYLIKDKKTAIIDTVKAPYADYLLNNISKYVELKDVDYVISNHAEPDHSGSLPHLMKLCQNAKLVCNEKCQKTLSMYYDTGKWNFQIVDEKTELSLGANTLRFINTPMAHWPESMATYIPEQKILFSMDIFGQHLATSNRFDDEVCLATAMYEARKYYANIIMLYGKSVMSVFEKIVNLEINIIAPSHGIIWKKHISEIVSKYKDWAVCKATSKILIFYDTMWKSTAMMANAIYEGASETNKIVLKKYDLKSTNITDIATESLDAAVLAVGSPTLNKTLMPKVAEALTYLKGLAPKDKAAIAFGSYGWAKIGGQDDVQKYLQDMNCQLLLPEPLQAQFVPSKEILNQCYETGKMLAQYASKFIDTTK